MPCFHIFLLGSMRAEWNNVSVRFDTTKIQALLTYLLLERETVHSRETLAGVFWPDSPQREAMQSLRQAISRLQRSLGDSADLLQVTRKTIQIEPACGLWLDVTEFDTALDECSRHPHRHLAACIPCLERLQQAVSLYQGDLLAGFPLSDSWAFNEWLSIKREYYQRRVIEALTFLTRAYLHREEAEAAHTFAWKQVALQPWNEQAHQQLMQALALAGQRSAALMQFEVCKRTLAQELNVEPDDHTVELYERIKASPSETARVEIGVKRPHRVRVPLSPMIGRQEEQQALLEFLAVHNSRILTITGLGGSGKTHLALQVAWDAAGTFTDGIYFVPLATVNDINAAFAAICKALGCAHPDDVSPAEATRAWLRGKEVLLVLDNVEQLTQVAARPLANLLAEMPGLKIICTSRQNLNVHGEQTLQLHGLNLRHANELNSEHSQELITCDAVKLFLATARRIDPTFSLARLSTAEQKAVLEICELVAGNPLAINLAAAWVRALPPSEIANEIKHNLGILTAFWQDTPDRHRSVGALLEETWSELESEAQSTLCRLSVFEGNFDRAGATEVSDASPLILRVLTERMLVEKRADQVFHIHPLVRQYAMSKLGESGAGDEARQRHCRFILNQFVNRSNQTKRNTTVAWNDVQQAWRWAAENAWTTELEKSLAPLCEWVQERGLISDGVQLLEATAVTLRSQNPRTAPHLVYRLDAERERWLKEARRTAPGLG